MTDHDESEDVIVCIIIIRMLLQKHHFNLFSEKFDEYIVNLYLNFLRKKHKLDENRQIKLLFIKQSL